MDDSPRMFMLAGMACRFFGMQSERSFLWVSNFPNNSFTYTYLCFSCQALYMSALPVV